MVQNRYRIHVSRLLLLLLLGLLAACNPVAIQPEPSTGQVPTPIVQEEVAPTLTAELSPSATPEPVTDTTETLCPEVPRPALIMYTSNGASEGLLLTDPVGEAQCALSLTARPDGPVISAGGSLFYQVMDYSANTITVWQLAPDGSNQPLAFTSQGMEPYPLFNFTVSEDGRKIAWSRATASSEAQGPRFQNHLWVANIDGSEVETLLDAFQTGELYAQPLRFSPDNAALFVALQPTGLGGVWSIFSGRYQALYRLERAGGEPVLLFDCAAIGEFLCIGDFSPDGSQVAYVNRALGVMQISAGDSILGTFRDPDAAWIGFPTFSPTGQLAFTTANLVENIGPPIPSPGSINLVDAPYQAPPTTLLTDAEVAMPWQWLDENHLIYHIVGEQRSGMAIVAADGRTWPLSGHPLGILR